MLRLALVPILFASCISTSAQRLHHPDLRLPELAKSADADSRVFNSYNPNGPVRWNQGWPWKFDLTGIGWDISTAVTAITPRHVVMADHYQRKIGGPVVFHDRKGRPHRRVLLKIISTSQEGLRSDVAVGLLDRPLPESIRTYPLLEASEAQAKRLIGARVLITEQDRRLFFHQIHTISENFIRFRFDPDLPDSRKKRLISGDSGNPSFILSKGELALIETHTGGGPGAGPFYGSAKLITVLRKIVASLDSSYQLRTIGIDGKVFKEAEIARAKMPQPSMTSPPAQQAAPDPGVPASSSKRKPRPRVVVPATQ